MIPDRGLPLHCCRPGLGWVAICLAAQIFCSAAAPAQTPEPQVNPLQFGINIPPGPLQPGDDQCFILRDELGNPTVAKCYVKVGNHSILLMPNGQLIQRRTAETQPTDQPFEPISQDQIAEQIKSTIEKRLGSRPEDIDRPRFRVRKTRHYVFVYDTSDAFASVASRVMNSMIGGIMRHARNQRIDVHNPEVPLAVIMFRRERDYQQYQRMPPGMVAYYETLSNHVVMFEESPLASVLPELARQQSISTMAHEGAHQILHNIGVQRRLSNWPMWLAEGLAEYFAPTSTSSRLRWKGAGEVNDIRMTELEEYLKSKAEGLDGKTLEQTIGASRLSSTGYASAWSLTHYLASKHRVDFNRFVHATSQLGPFQGDSKDNLATFKECFGADLASLEQRVVTHLKKQPYRPPFARFRHYVVTISYPTSQGTKRVAKSFLMRESADQWRREALGNLSENQRTEAKSQTHVLPNRDMANRFKNDWLARR